MHRCAPRKLLFAALLIFLLIPMQAFSGPWEPVGPFGGNVRDVVADPTTANRLYAASLTGGVFVSTNNGATWTQRSEGLPFDASIQGYRPISGLAVDITDARTYAVGGTSINVSLDQGLLWTELPRPAGQLGEFIGIHIDPGNPQVLYLHNARGVFKSTTRGQSWTQPSGITETVVWALEPAPSNAAVFYAVAGFTPALFRSTDSVAGWTRVANVPGTTFLDLAVDPADANRLTLSMDTGCFESTDGGANWTPLSGVIAESIHKILYDAPHPFLVGRGGLYAYDADASDYERLGNFYYTRATAALELADATLVASDGGLFRITRNPDGSLHTVEPSNTGMRNADIPALVAAQTAGVLYAGTGLSFDGGVYRTADGGDTWELRSSGLTNLDIRSLEVFAGDPNIVFAGTADALDDTGENGAVFRSTDGGLHWTDISTTIDLDEPHIVIAIEVHPTNPDIIYASLQGRFGGIFRTADGGATWERRAQGLQYLPNLPGTLYETDNPFENYYAALSLVLDPANPSRLFIGAGGCWGGTYRTVNEGTEWLRRSTGFMEEDQEVTDSGFFPFPVHLELFDIDLDPDNPNHLLVSGSRGAFIGNEQFGILFESTDGGDTWSLIRERTKSDYFTAPVSAAAFRPGHPGTYFLASRAGVQITENGGVSWAWMNEGLSPRDVLSRTLVVDPTDSDRIFLANATSGVWRRDLTPTPVRLTGLSAQMVESGAVEVRWTVLEATDHAGFHVDRSANGIRERLTPDLLRGQREYLFEDPQPIPGVTNHYWVVERARTGAEESFGPLAVEVGTTRPLTLGPAVPNPFSAGTRVELSLPAATDLTVEVFNHQGQRVRTLRHGLAQGRITVEWDGTNDQGTRAVPGLYFVSVRAGDSRLVRKVVLVR